jgi:hypothetical protein
MDSGVSGAVMDEADFADRTISQMVEVARMASAMELSKMAASTGYCLNCDEPLDDGRRWCDAECCKDWQARTSRPR